MAGGAPLAGVEQLVGGGHLVPQVAHRSGIGHGWRQRFDVLRQGFERRLDEIDCREVWFLHPIGQEPARLDRSCQSLLPNNCLRHGRILRYTRCVDRRPSLSQSFVSRRINGRGREISEGK